MTDSFDYLVIGGGSGGVRSARIAASLGAKVAIVEGSRWGGTCVNLGCVPKKLLGYGSEFHSHFRDAIGYGWDLDTPSFDWQRLIRNKDREIARINRVYEQLLDKAGVTWISAQASFAGPNEISLEPVVGSGYTGPTRIKAKFILIATGSTPFRLDIPGASHALVSDDLFHMASLPKRMLINGSGYIAVEFASILAGVGGSVDLVYRAPKLLKRFDTVLGDALADVLVKDKVTLWPERNLAAIEAVDGHYEVSLTKSGSQEALKIETDQVCFAAGRVPNVGPLGLDAIGIETSDRGAIKVNQAFQSSVPHIYAVGDVIDRVTLTPVAIREGTWVARHLFEPQAQLEPMCYKMIASAVFTHPPIAVCGLTEQEACAQGYAVEIFSSSFKPLRNTMSNNQQSSVMKMIVDKQTDRVLGLHMLGDDAPEILQGFAVAMKMGAKKSDFDATVAIHPTAAEEWVTLK